MSATKAHRDFYLPSSSNRNKLRAAPTAFPPAEVDHGRRAPTPPPKDTPSTPRTPNPDHNPNSSSSSSAADLSSYLLRPGRLSRAGSVYSLSRLSFTSQISQLTAVHLPDAASLRDSISSISNAPAAATTLIESANQIQVWISKASDVLAGLDAGDDIAWAAAPGRDGLGEVNQAIDRFEALIQVFVASVEELQLRKDASLVPLASMKNLVDQVEKITAEWTRIKHSFAQVKQQVELAIEWETLENRVLSDITNDMEELSRVVFEMEERRHKLPPSDSNSSPPQERVLDIDELETMLHEAPKITMPLDRRFSAELNLQSLTSRSAGSPNTSDESSLIGLFARLQPLRASLDFLPMKLSTFRGRAIDVFPTACDQLLQRRDALELQWKRLETDAEYLRKELGEDRWNLVFRNAGRQAIKLIDSVERSLIKVDESLGNDTQLRHTSTTIKKIENYEAKKVHYCPAIDRVLSIVDKGVRDRLTVNGEIIRLRADLRQRWQSLQTDMKHIDGLLEEYATDSKPIGQQQQQLRDSLSSILSNERSLTSSMIPTPGTSPPSSVVSRKGSSHDLPSLSPAPSAKISSEHVEVVAPVLTVHNAHSSISTSPPAHRTPIKPPTKPSIPMHTASPPNIQGTPRHTSTPLKPTRLTPRQQLQPAQSDRPRWSYSRSGGDYNVSDYYKSLMAKGSSHKPNTRASSLNTATPGSSPLSEKSATSRSVSRPALSRKPSDLSGASTQPRSRTTEARTSKTHGPQESPLSVSKRKPTPNAGSIPHTPSSGSSYRSPSNSQSKPHDISSTVTASHITTPSSSPRTSLGPLSTPRSRRASHIPLPVDRGRLVSSPAMSHADQSGMDIATVEDLPHLM